jgi:hypothetical protein
MKKKTFFAMLLIIVLGTVLRLIFISKPEGLWNDEYVSWSIASVPLGKGFINAVFSQCHMPFYYLYLKFFMLLGDNDTFLRLTSVFAGILSIIGMYLVGKEFKDEQLGVLCAFVAALSSFLIYFSQEVRFYEILFFFSSLSLLFTLKICRDITKKNLVGYLLSNLLIMFTHTIGFIFVFFNMVFVSLCLYKKEKNRKNIILLWSGIFLLSLAGLPLIFKIFTTHSYSQWWGHFTLSRLAFLITDYFSPILTNIVSAPDSFLSVITLQFIIFALLPSLIAILGLIKALKTKDYRITGLFLVALSYIFSMIIASIAGKLVFITKYSIEIYPILILIASFGWLEFKNKLKILMIFSFLFLSLFYLIASPVSAPKLHRAEGHKIAAELLKNADLAEKDYILLLYYPKERFEKYFDFKKYNVISINKGNFTQYLNMNNEEALLDGREKYQSVFAAYDDKYFAQKFNDLLINKLKSGQKLSIVILKDVAFYSPMQMQVLTKNQQLYNKTPFLFLVFSHLRNQLLQKSLKNLQILRIEEKGSWSIVTFRKK